MIEPFLNSPLKDDNQKFNENHSNHRFTLIQKNICFTFGRQFYLEYRSEIASLH